MYSLGISVLALIENLKKGLVKYGVNIVDRSSFSGVTRVQCGILWRRVRDCEELVGLMLTVEIDGKAKQPRIGKEVFIPAKAMHTVSNVGMTNNVWYYGDKRE